MSSKILTKLINILIGLALIIILLQVGFAQTNPVNNTFTIKSTILGEDQKVFVYLPKDYEKSEAKYPVVYLLDGEYNSSFTADAVKTLSSWTNRMPACIVIGITSNNRERDLTTAPDKNWQPPQPIPGAGGANNFLDYIEKELIPFVDKNYRTQPLRTIIGHSLGGLFAVNALSVKPGLFRFYILLDSSIWWDDGRVAKRAMDYLTNHPNYNGRIAWLRDKIPHEVWFEINKEFLAYLENKRPAGLSFTFMELENETHSSLVFPGTYFGLREIFTDFAFKFEEKTDLAAVQKHYRKLSENYGYSVSIPEQIYNNLSGQLIYLKNLKDAIAAGEMWIKDYPKSSSAYENLGKAYLENGNKESAINNLKKSIELNPENPRAKELLKQVEK